MPVFSRRHATRKKQNDAMYGHQRTATNRNPLPPLPSPRPLLLSATALVSTVSLPLAALCSTGVARAFRLPPCPPGGVGLT